MLVPGAEKDVVDIDEMFSFNGSSVEVLLLSGHAWRLRTGVFSSSAKETILPLSSMLRFVAVRSVLQGGNSVTECLLVVLQTSFSVRVEILLLWWHSKQASSVLSIIEISTFAWPFATLLVLALRLSTACQPVNMSFRSLGNCVVTTSRTFFHPLHVLLKKQKHQRPECTGTNSKKHFTSL